MSKAKVILVELEQASCLSFPRSIYGTKKNGCDSCSTTVWHRLGYCCDLTKCSILTILTRLRCEFNNPKFITTYPSCQCDSRGKETKIRRRLCARARAREHAGKVLDKLPQQRAKPNQTKPRLGTKPGAQTSHASQLNREARESSKQARYRLSHQGFNSPGIPMPIRGNRAAGGKSQQ
jgi:hypothetical protein